MRVTLPLLAFEERLKENTVITTISDTARKAIVECPLLRRDMSERNTQPSLRMFKSLEKDELGYISGQIC